MVDEEPAGRRRDEATTQPGGGPAEGGSKGSRRPQDRLERLVQTVLSAAQSVLDVLARAKLALLLVVVVLVLIAAVLLVALIVLLFQL